MLDELTDEQIESYQKNGFLVIENFLDSNEVDRLHANVAAAAEARGDARMANETKVTTGGGLRVSQPEDRKRPWGEPTGWHMDTPAFSFTHSAASTFWFALVDCDLSNGCMHYIPGSHKSRMRTKGSMRIDSLGQLNPKWATAEPVACPVRAGAMIVHNGDTAHASCANMTPRPRPAFAISWMPCGSTFNGTPNILPTEVLATIKVGDRIDFDEYFPVVYSRS
jgi:phytanoyl-CoA hydroxylase